MSQQLAVVTYGNGDILREIFNAVAAGMGDSTFQTLIHLSILLAGVWAIARLIFKRDLIVGVAWIALYFMAFYVLFLPKATIQIIDRVAAGKVYTVDNVPLGLAWLANLTSAIGDSLTQLTEQNFSLPDDLRYGKTGMVMASNLITAASTFQVMDPDFEQSLQSFINQCVFYDLLLHKYSAQELVTTPNIWQFVTQRASPARAFLYHQSVVTCRDGAASLTEEWQSAIAQAEDRYAARLFPDESQAKVQLLKYLPLSYQFLTNLSESASDLMQQNMMANAIQSGLLSWSARTNAPAALEGYAFNKAQQQNRMTHRTVGDMAAYWLPLLKNVFEGILYGSFIFIFLLLLFPFGLRVLRQYVYSLLWLQLWAPLYAIINLYVTFYAQHRSLGAVTLGTSVQGLVLATQSGLAQVNADMSGLAGYISLSVPLLAASLVTGFHGALSHIGQYVGGAIQSSAAGSAGEAASGNLSLGNTSLNTHNAYNTSANHFDTMARAFSGGVTEQMPGGSTLNVTPDGSMVMNNQSAISNLGVSLQLSDAIRSSATQQADQAYSAALSHQNSYNEAISAAERGVVELSRHQALSEASGKSFVTSESASDLQALNQVQQDNQSVSQNHNTSESASHNRQLEGGLSGRVGAGYSGDALPINAHVGGNVGANESWNHGQSEQQSFSHSESSVDMSSAAHNRETVFRGVAEGSYRANTEEGQRLLDSISTSLDRAHQEQQQASAQFQQAETYRKIASVSEEQAASINANASQEFMNEIQKEQGLRSIEKTMVNHPEQAQARAREFVQEKAEQFIKDFSAGESASREKVSEWDQENQSRVALEETSGGVKSVKIAYEKIQREIQSRAHQEGLDQNTLIDKRPAENVGKVIVEKNFELERAKVALQEKKETAQHQIQKNQKNIAKKTELIWGINRLDKEKN